MKVEIEFTEFDCDDRCSHVGMMSCEEVALADWANQCGGRQGSHAEVWIDGFRPLDEVARTPSELIDLLSRSIDWERVERI